MTRIKSFALSGWWLGALGLILIVIGQWLLLGFHSTNIADSWSILTKLDSAHPHLFWSQTSRPLTYWPWVLAYALSSETLYGITALLVAFFSGQAVALYALLRRLLPGNSILAFCGAALFVLYPTDVGLAYDGALNIHCALLIYLLSANFFLAYWDSGKPFLLVLLALAQAACMLMYEASFPLIFATPLLLVFKTARLDRRVVRAVGLWYLVPVLVVAYIAFLLLRNGELGEYQTRLLTPGAASTPLANLADMGGSIVRLFTEHFWTTWQNALQYSPFKASSPLFWTAVATGAVVLVIGLMLRHSSRQQYPMRRYWLLLGVGIAALVLAFLAYVPTVARHDSFRVFIMARTGAAITVTALLYIIASGFRKLHLPVFLLLSAVFVSLASIRFLDLTRVMMERSLQQQQIIDQIVTVAPELRPGTNLVLLDTPGVTNGQEAFIGLSLNFAWAMQVVYGDLSLTGHLCFPSEMTFGVMNERCELREDGYTIYSNDEPLFTGSFESAVIFEFTSTYPDFTIALLEALPFTDDDTSSYDPHSHINADAPYPSRFYTLIDRRPLVNRS